MRRLSTDHITTRHCKSSLKLIAKFKRHKLASIVSRYTILHTKSLTLFGDQSTPFRVVVKVDIVTVGISGALPNADLDGRARGLPDDFVGLAWEDASIAVSPEALAQGDSVAWSAGSCTHGELGFCFCYGVVNNRILQ